MKKVLLVLSLLWSCFINAQSITITQPNGGEVLASCQVYPVKWTQTGSPSNYWNIDYSLDGGTIWTSVASNFLSTNGQFMWTVPNVQSSTVLMRVYDAMNASTVDQSNAYFTINIPIVLNSPNGGEVWQGATLHNITWTALGTSNTYNIAYSTNGGSTWTNIVTNYATVSGSYTWTVPNIPSSNCLVRVQDYVQNCMQDISLTTFTITPAQPVLYSPNGGELLQQGCSQTITWDASTFFTTVRLEYSLNNGSTWTQIASATTNDGSQGWSVPTTASGLCLVRASNSTSLSVNDVSNATFTIAPGITVTSPNGGETLYGCNYKSITWQRTSCSYYYDLEYSIDGGSTWTPIITGLSLGSTTTGSYNWQVPNGISSSQCRVRVKDNYGVLVSDMSDADFTILPSNDITVTSPNGGQSLVGLSTYTVTWTNLPTASGSYQLQYSTNNGSTWSTIASNITGNAYGWSVPNIPSTNCLIKVIDYANTCKYDISDATFTITPAQPVLYSPNGGETLYSGMVHTITWDASTFFTTVRLDYSLDNGATWINIATATTNDGSQSWTVPNVSSTQCLVKASNSTSVTVNDVSNTTFTIKPAVTIITPNGDNGVTIWGGCTATSITFDRSPAWNSYLIEYSINNGATWTTIINGWTTSANPATYNWNIPNASSSQVKVRVTPTSATTYGDQSDAAFTITKPVTIIQPNFGGVMQAGTVYPIKWTSDGISNIYDIFYSTNGGTTYTNIVMGYNTSTNTYSWTVPATVSNNCKIIVRDNINTCKNDTSDQAFIIQTGAPAITLLNPNGGDTLRGCSTYAINWTDAITNGSYNLAYSTNSGSSWVNIVTNYTTTTRSYNWVVPNTVNSNNVLVRVQSATTLTTLDLSDALLSIKNGALLATPANTAICSGAGVQLTASGGINYTWTPSASLTSASISNPVASPTVSTIYTVQSVNGTCILSNTVNIVVSSPGATANVVITASPSNSVCLGSTVTFSANPSNGGPAPSYQWILNGTGTGVSTPTYSSNTLSHNDVVQCLMTSNLSCASNNPALSNSITINMSSGQTPSVTISVSPSNTICPGTLLTFSANPMYGGTAPTYIWKLNGTTVGGSTATYTNNTLTNGNVVTVIMTSNAGCLTSSTATSIPMAVTVNTTPAIPSAINGNTVVCANSVYAYTAAAVSGATAYNWTLPGGWSGSSTSNTIAATTGANGGAITVQASNACGTSSTRILSVSVGSPTVTITGDSALCAGSSVSLTAGGASSYTWSTSQNTSTISTSPVITTTYSVTGADADGCTNTASKTVTVNVLPVISVTSPTICGGSTATVTASGASTYTWNTGAIGADLVVTPAANTDYTVTGTSAFGCVDTETASVTLTSAPSITVNSEVICSGNAAILTASGVSTYTWSTGENTATISVTPSATSEYTVSGEASGCPVQVNQTATVTVNSSPAITAASNNTLLCVGQTATLSANGANTYTWSTTETGSDISVNPTTTTDYTVTGEASNGCTSTTVITQVVDLCTGVAGAKATGVQWTVYPNPFKDKITVMTDGTKLQLKVFNSLGAVIYTAETESSLIEIDLREYAAGIYYLKAGPVTRKIIKE